MSNGVVVVPFLDVTADVQVAVIRAPIGQPVNQPWIAVEGEDNRPIGREHRVELVVGEAVGMLGSSAGVPSGR